jgi:hypothetical protein
MPLYFAYGANMDREAMASRCPRAKPLGLARLARHRLAVMREGWLTAARDPSGTVHGVLWDLAFADIPALDRYEGAPQGLYAKIAQPVVGPNGPKSALVYFGANAGPGTPRPDYLAEVVAAARSWPLPEDAIAALQTIGRSVAGRASSPRARGEKRCPEPRSASAGERKRP